MLKMNENSLFAILLRARWWVSLAVAAGVFFLARLFVPPFYAAFVPLPFLVIAGVALWRQLQQPSARVAFIGMLRPRSTPQPCPPAR